MADDKQITSDLDDWLEDLDESDEFSGELDQANIDALLSGSLEPGKPGPKKEAPAANISGELDQANIDALLSGSLEPEKPGPKKEAPAANISGELDQANIDALLSGSFEFEGSGQEEEPVAEASVELDQDNIDALLGGMADNDAGTETKMPEILEENASVDLDQANIDALFSDLNAPPTPQTPTSPMQREEPVNSQETDHDNIDLLLGDEDDETHQGDAAVELDQDNIDALLRDVGSRENGTTARASSGDISLGQGQETDQDEIDQLFSGFDNDEIEEPFLSEEAELARELEDEEDLLGVAESAPSNNLSSGDVTVAGDTDDMNQEKNPQDKKTGGFFPSIGKTIAAVVTLCMVALVGAGVYFFHFRTGKEPAIPVETGQPVAQMEEPAATVPEAVNHIPVVSDSLYTMPETGGDVQIVLSASDADGDPISYEVTILPQHGRLSGSVPSLIYLPNKDFSGEDRFEYRAVDGKESSVPAKVIITGPSLAKLAEEKEKAATAKKATRPKQSAIHAGNRTFDTTSTAKLIINWERIWREANHAPFNANVSVDIDDSRLKGRLSKISAGKYVYQPDPAFTGNDILRYRFKKGGLSSGSGKVTMRVTHGDSPPKIHIAGMADAYMVGETVRIDASPTRDEQRSNLTFRWEQVSGAPAQINKNNQEGSIVTFAMPSSFYTSAEPGPVLRVTAMDASGQSDSQVIKVHTISRRKSALWGMADGGSEGSKTGLR